MPSIVIIADTGTTDDARRLGNFLVEARHQATVFQLSNPEVRAPTNNGGLPAGDFRSSIDRAFSDSGCVLVLVAGDTAMNDPLRISRIIQHCVSRPLVCIVYFLHSPSTTKARELWASLNQVRTQANGAVQLSVYNGIQDLIDRVKIGIARADGRELAEILDPGRRYVSLCFVDQDRVGLLQDVCAYALESELDILFLEQHTLGPMASVSLLGRLCGTGSYSSTLNARDSAVRHLSSTVMSGIAFQSSVGRDWRFPNYVEFNGPGAKGLPLVLEPATPAGLQGRDSRMYFLGRTVESKAGILHSVAKLVARHGVSIIHTRVYSVRQDEATINVIKLRANISTIDSNDARTLKAGLKALDGFERPPIVELQ